jgi:hypothetical protein
MVEELSKIFLESLPTVIYEEFHFHLRSDEMDKLLFD